MQSIEKKFTTNQYSSSNRMENRECSSAKKLKPTAPIESDMLEKSFNFLINFKIFEQILLMVGSCPDCRSGITLEEVPKKRMGFSLCLSIACSGCSWKHEIQTSQPVNNAVKSPGRQMQIVNLLSVIAFREIGRGHEALKTFSACMDMPAPITIKAFNAINRVIHQVYGKVAFESMQRAANEIKIKHHATADASGIVDCQVSVDGTWQKRSYSSLNGVVTAISEEGKVIDLQAMTKYCKLCEYWSRAKCTAEYEEWLANHQVLIVW